MAKSPLPDLFLLTSKQTCAIKNQPKMNLEKFNTKTQRHEDIKIDGIIDNERNGYLLQSLGRPYGAVKNDITHFQC